MKTFDHTILLLQGGGALGAYQAGVYEGMAEAGIVPDWVVGISIGAVNSALIAGNPPERRVERLREWWKLVSSNPSAAELIPESWVDGFRPLLNHMGFASVATFGVPGFFTPRIPHPWFAPRGSNGAMSVYDTGPMKATLERLVDFDLINHSQTRISLGAVNVRTGLSTYFDSRQVRIHSDHVRASGALPPGFPPIEIDGEYYFDGGVASNSPLQYVWDEKPLTTALIIMVDLFPARGELPTNLDEVQERVKDIQYSSKARMNIERTRELGELRAAMARLLAKLPPELKSDPDAQKLGVLCDNRDWTLVRFVDRRRPYSGQWKDCHFSREIVNERWNAGLEDVRFAIANKDSVPPCGLGPGVRVYDAMASATTASSTRPEPTAATRAPGAARRRTHQFEGVDSHDRK